MTGCAEYRDDFVAGETHLALRLTDRKIAELLDALDSQSLAPQATARRTPRFVYRFRVVVEFLNAEGDERVAVATRNLSRDGIGFLINRYVYPGARCRFRLISEFNYSEVVEGTVARCRLLSGTAGVHEVGCEFNKPIDVSLFHPSASSLRILLVGFDEARAEVLRKVVERFNVGVDVAISPENALEQTRESFYDLILSDLDSSEKMGCEAVRALRQSGYVLPIVSLTVQAAADAPVCAGDKPCLHCKISQISQEQFIPLLKQLRSEPVISNLARDPSMHAAINGVVQRLRAEVQSLQQVFSAGDTPGVLKILDRLVMLSSTTGFSQIRDAVQAARYTLERAALPHESREALAEVIRTCRAARPASAAGNL